MAMDEDTYEFDLCKKKVISECNLSPAETSKSNFPYLHAENNKYPLDRVDLKKVGKWTMFLPKDSVNSVWEKIKMAVTRGELWQTCVSTCDPQKPNDTHTVMIYTKNYADIDDVIHVLNFLEKSGIKPPNVTSMYQPDHHIHEFSKPWIYTSDTVRAMASDYTYEFDIGKKEVVTNCNLCPTKVFQIPSYLTAKNNKYSVESIDPKKVGKWTFHLPKDSVDAVWDKIKTAVMDGELWRSKVSTTDPEEPKDHNFMIYTKDYTDSDDVIRVLDFLETSGMKPPNENIKYSKDKEIKKDKGSGRLWIYSSNLIRSMGSSIHPHYMFDIVKKQLITDSKLYPTETLKSDFNWLYASNNKFAEHEKAGQWVLLLPKNGVNAAWDKIKAAITSGELWSSRMSTTDPEKPDDPYTLMVDTKDYADLDDIIRVLDYLEKSGTKAPDVNIKYKTDLQADASRKEGEQDRWLYTSDTVRTASPICYTYEFDVREKKVVTDCNLYPTDFVKIPPWLEARNNKYADESVDDEKVGHWTFFAPTDSVNATWDKVKMAVTRGELWRCEVSTVDPKKFGILHIFMVATKDYTDVDDVTQVLDVLESSNIKPPNVNIKYTKGEPTMEAAANKAKTGRSWVYSANLIRTVGSSIHDTYKFDIHKQELVTDCKLYPSETLESDFELLNAENNKYSEETVDPEKMGKWILTLPKVCVNAAWDKIKTAVSNGELWRCSVSTTDPNFDKYCVVIYTKDYTDVNDVIHVLEFLESSGIKPRDTNIKYRKEKGSSGEIGRSFIYTSNLIRTKGASINYRYEFDIHKKEVVSDSILYPTEALKSDFEWLYVKNNKYVYSFEDENGIDHDNTGKWMIFLSKDEINATWDKIKLAVTNGDLWQAKVSATDPERPNETYAIMIYTKDYTDVDDVIQVLNYLETSGIKPPNVTLKYKRDQLTSAGIYSGGREKSWTYSSDLIRSTGGFIQDTYEYDILKRALVTDSDVNPTQAHGRPPWLYAKNNKYFDEVVDPEKVGKWMLFLGEDRVNAAWDKVKTAVANGELWCNKVSTFKKKNYPIGDSYTLMIYTKDSTDREDVIQVLEYLESSGIKPPSADIKYRTDDILKTETGFRSDHRSGPKPWLYSSNTIRSSGSTQFSDNSIPDTYEFDIRRKEVITECDLCPTRIRGKPSWLYAKNNKYPKEVVDPRKIGQWVLFLREDVVDAVWDKIKTAVASGELWSAKVSTFWQRNYPVGDSYTVMINTKDCADVEDVIRVLDFIERAKIKHPNENITYRSDGHSQSGYRTGGQKPMYFSKTVRNEFKMDLPWR